MSDDLWLLLFLVLGAIAVVVMTAGFAIAVVVGVNIIVLYIRFLISLWREGKKGWFWTLFIPGVAITIVAVVFLGGQIVESNRQRTILQQKQAEEYASYKRLEQQKKEEVNRQKIEAEQARNRIPIILNDLPVVLVFDGVRGEEKNFLHYDFHLEPSKELRRLEEVSGWFEWRDSYNFIVESIHTWKFNGEPYDEFTLRNELPPISMADGRFSDWETHFRYNNKPWIVVEVRGPDAFNLRELCMRIKALPKNGGRGKELCIQINTPK